MKCKGMSFLYRFSNKPMRLHLFIGLMILMINGCSSPSVRQVDTIKERSYLTPEVQFNLSPDFDPNSIHCIAVGAFENVTTTENPSNIDISAQLRKATYGVLSAKNYRDVELSRVDYALEQQENTPLAQLRCDALLTGKITKFSRTSLIAYAYTSLEVEMELTHQNRTTLWKAWYGARNHDGTAPLSPLSLMTGVIDVAMDGEEDTYQLIDAAARQIISTIPDRESLTTFDGEPLDKLLERETEADRAKQANPATWLEDGQYERALEIAQTRIQEKPDDQDSLIIASQASLLLDQTEEAINFAMAAVRLDSSNPSALNALGLSYLKNNELILAEGAFKKIIANQTGGANDFYNLGLVQMAAQKFDDASLNFYAAGQMAILEGDRERLYFSLKKLNDMQSINPLAAAKYNQLGGQIQTYLDQ